MKGRLVSDTESRIADLTLEGVRELWGAVLLQAVWDIQYGSPAEQGEAWTWVNGQRENIGSFRFICELCGVQRKEMIKHIEEVASYKVELNEVSELNEVWKEVNQPEEKAFL